MIEEVGGTIDWAKNKINSLTKAKNELGPLLDALGQPLTQIVGGVGMLLAGVLNLVGKLVRFRAYAYATTKANEAHSFLVLD